MDLLAFADFVLAWNNHRNHPASVGYFFKIFDIQHKVGNDVLGLFRCVRAGLKTIATTHIRGLFVSKSLTYSKMYAWQGKGMMCPWDTWRSCMSTVLAGITPHLLTTASTSSTYSTRCPLFFSLCTVLCPAGLLDAG
jgi:hypothetical protein